MSEELRELEQRLLLPEVRRNRTAVSALLAEEFREFGSSGRIFDKQQILDLLGSEPEQRMALEDFGAWMLSAEIALVTYRAVRPGSGAASLRSSVWVRRDGRWQLIFHQGTRIASE